MLVTGCGRSSTPTPTPVATAPSPAAGPRLIGDGVVASGEVVPAQTADLSFTVSGLVQTVAVKEGNEVQPGQLLVRLETGILEANVAQAEAALAAAQAQLELLNAGPRPGEISAAQAQLQAAEAALVQAAAQRDQPDLGASDAEIADAQAQVAATMADQRQAAEFHDKTMTCVNVRLPSGEKKKICPALGTYEEQARFSLHAADEAQAAAQAQLDALLDGGDAELWAAQAGVQAATAQRDAAQAQLDLLQAGPSAEEVAVTQAAVDQAQAALDTAHAALDLASLCAPAAGIISALEVSPGESVVPGQAVLTLADLHHLQIHTTDLSERDMTQVAAGQSATVYVESLDATVDGQVVRIAPRATTVGGDVVYTVVVDLVDPPAGLRWGMSVEVQILTE
jgi:multidrug efflux pump subunit AcrA (membrane-fusion protein)